MCIDAPESTTNSLSSGLILDSERRHHFSVGEKNAVFFFSINFQDFLSQLPRCFASPMLLSFCLFLRPILKFWANFCWAMDFGLELWQSAVLFWWIEHFGLVSAWLSSSVKYRWRLRRLHVLEYTTQIICLFHHSHCTVCAILFRPFAGLLFNPAVCEDAFIPEFASRYCLVQQALQGMPLFTRWILTGTLRMFLARLTRYFPRRTFPLGLFDIDKFFPSCACVVCSGEGVGCVVAFARLLLRCRKLHGSPFVHCPLALVLCEREAVPSDSWPKCFTQFSHSCLKVPWS